MVWRRNTTVDVGRSGKEKWVGGCVRNCDNNETSPACDERIDANDNCWS